MILDLINLGTKKLEENKIETPRLDATLLLGKVINKDRLYMLTNGNEEISLEDEKEYFSLIEERMKNKPIKYILGTCEFMGLDLNVKRRNFYSKRRYRSISRESFKRDKRR